jgi:translation elongation factor EF-1beta
MAKRVMIEIQLVPESKDIDNKQIEKEIRESLKCDWLAEIEKSNREK